MTLKFRIAVCWIMTISLAAASVGAVMGTFSSRAHQMQIAAGLAFMVILNGWHWWLLHKIPSSNRALQKSKT